MAVILNLKVVGVVLANNLTNVLLKESNNLPERFQENLVYEKSFLTLTSPHILADIQSAMKLYKSIVLTDVPLGINNYNDYEKYVIQLLEQIQGYQNIYIYNDLFLANILTNINNYKNLKGVYITTYGLCMKESNDILKLFSYYINQETLQSMKPSTTELVVQTNSICSATKNVSNTFGSELWLLDFLFQVSLGQVNTVVIETDNLNNIYPYIIFKMVSNGKLYKTEYATKNNIACYTTRDYINYYVTLIHKDVTIDFINVNIQLDSMNTGALYKFTCNQTILGTSGISFGKVDYTSDNYIKDTVLPKDGKYTFSINTMNAYVLVVPIKQESQESQKSQESQDGGGFFEDINNSDEKSTVITVNPNPLTEEYDNVPTTMNVRTFKKEYVPDY